MDSIFVAISVMIIVATVFAYFARLFRQPMIPAYILTGVLLGPILGVVTNTEIIATLSEIGIAFLLFIVGLEIDIKKLSNVGLVSSLGGLIQVIATFSGGFVLALLLGLSVFESFFVGIIVAFSSTMVVVKLLSDKKEIDTLHGRIVIGILLMQDLIALFVLSALANLNGSALPVIISILEVGAIIIIAIFLSKYIFPTIFKFAAKSRELLFLMSISVCLASSLIAVYLKLSLIIGAFVAGVALANLPYNFEIIGRVKSLRDFFSTIFFVSLGLELVPKSISSIIAPLILISLFVILIKPFIILFLCSYFGYKRRTGFISAISMAQISEFSLIIVAGAVAAGQIESDSIIFSLTILLAIITITITAYYVKFENFLYKIFSVPLKAFDRFTDEEEEEMGYKSKVRGDRVVLCGQNRVGYSIEKTLHDMKKNVLVVDFNPEVIKKLIKQKRPCMYGDIGDIDVIERMNLKNASMVISTVQTKEDNLLLIKKAREHNRDISIFVTANDVEEALELYDSGADYVILPHFLGGEHVSFLIRDIGSDIARMVKHKLTHIKELKHRRDLGHERGVHAH